MRSATRVSIDWTKTQRHDINRPLFEELDFVRLANTWQTCRRTTSLFGAACQGKIFQRYEMIESPLALLEFNYRGHAISGRSARTFHHTLQKPHVLTSLEPMLLIEVVGASGPQCSNQVIDHAEVGAVNGRMVLAVFWTDHKFGRRVISVFIDAEGDGRVVHEMHFSAPPELYATGVQVFNDTMRSCQWRPDAPPMVGSVA